MTTILSPASRDAASGGFRTDPSRGDRNARVSSEWFSRPDDERYLSLSDLHAATLARADRASARTVESRAIRVEASRDNAERLTLAVPGQVELVAPTHWSFGQMCSLVAAPSSYLRNLPAPLAAINLQHGLLSHRAELVKTLETEDGRVELRAVTGPDYGRIWGHELVGAVRKIASDGTGDTNWKVPGVIDWATMTHNPYVDITKETTTLYASDRDVFLFLVDDTGATRIVLDVRALEVCRMLGVEAHLVVSQAGEMARAYETDLTREDLHALADYVHPVKDVGASIASGSFRTMGMLIAPARCARWRRWRPGSRGRSSPALLTW
ncbi:hypothetical protein AA103196_2624 [Ameyamaea chiangmaiensis NBRC 103196]|nr:hypothetical protein AA103196_2624 [Ameyamaea chiangmaiensis NBRC 103196]